MKPAPNFDRLARIYRALEFLAFGRDLEQARFRHLDRLRDARNILVLGEGDGRCLVRLLATSPHAHIHCVDASPAMLEMAARRIPAADRHRVELTCGDAMTLELGCARYDAVTTLFFLDCFPDEQAGPIVARIASALQADATWLFADFVLPPRGWRHARAVVWLTVLYAFFRWQTGIGTRRLPQSERAIAAAGFRREVMLDLQHGLVRSAVYRRGE